MGTFSFENQGTHTFLVYEVGDNEQLNVLVTGMTTNNQIEGILPLNIQQKNMNVLCKYNISSLTSLEDFFRGDVTRKKIVSVLANLTKTILIGEQYLLDENDFIWNLKYIFLNSTTYETYIVTRPVENDERGFASFVEFVKEILDQIIFDESEDGTYIVKIRNYINRKDEFSYKKFLELLLSLINKSEEASVNVRVKNSINKTIKENNESKVQKDAIGGCKEEAISSYTSLSKPTGTIKKEDIQQEKAEVSLPKINGKKEQKKQIHQTEVKKSSFVDRLFGKKKEEQPKGTAPISFAVPGGSTVQSGQKDSNIQEVKPNPMPPENSADIENRQMAPKENDCGNTVLMDDDCGVTVLMTDAGSEIENGMESYYITRVKNGQKVRINKDLFRIGRSGEVADFYIGDNNQIGREHAFIIKADNSIFIKDNNSRNHTYVNNVMVQAGERVELKNGDEIRLANEVFAIDIER